MKQKLSALEYGENLLGRYSKTKKALRLKMKTKHFTEEEIDAAILELSKLGYLDDLRYSQNYVTRFAHKGNYLITKELRIKGVHLDHIEEALLSLDKEIKRAKKVAMDKWPTIQAQDLKQKEKKLVFFLSSRGFPYSVCRKTSKEMVVFTDQTTI